MQYVADSGEVLAARPSKVISLAVACPLLLCARFRDGNELRCLGCSELQMLC